MSYLLSEADHPEEPWAVLTGDSLFVSSAGRPDLLGEKFTRQLAEQQFHTLHDFYLNSRSRDDLSQSRRRLALRRRHRRAVEQHDRLRKKIQ
jgi:hypothetical protein